MQSRRSAASSQIEALEAYGVSVIYVEGQRHATFDDALHSLRGAEPLHVKVLADMASNRDELRERIAAVHDRGHYVKEVSTGRDSRKDLADMVFDAVDLLAQRKKGHDPKQARKYGMRGGRPKKDRGTPEDKAEKIWFNTVKYESNDDAVEAMNRGGGSWTVKAAWKAFGPSGRKTGRRTMRED